ncbi:LIM domain containing protein [Trichuris trichiura]|uniref:LIM domain containing protein n=1 Tax=Trichuris trichiura TaxID=36087 RepID=A0A077YYZ4_TRITR|nr:LIM domain containing protein [Trichuris trichiura]
MFANQKDLRIQFVIHFVCVFSPLTVSFIFIGSPADVAGLKPGYTVTAINGLPVEGDYLAKANMLIREAAVVGELDLSIRPCTTVLTFCHNLKNLRTAEMNKLNYGQDKLNCNLQKDSEAQVSLRQLPYVRSLGSSSSADYRVVSMHEQKVPGKISDFVPEYEREAEHSNIYSHWMVREAERKRLSEQLSTMRLSDAYNDFKGGNGRSENGFTKSESQDEELISVSAKHRCSHCGEELGRGCAMSIESLALFYHLQCFKCHVCGVSLGDGAAGADVRVRSNKLHCQSCYSNDEGIRMLVQYARNN